MRLIDADALVKDLSYLYTKNHIPVDMRAKEILTTIMEQPEAYDIEKVVEELEELKMRYFLTIANTGDEKSDFAYENVRNVLDKAIEIVKQDGVSKDCNNCANYTLPDKLDNCYLCCKGYEDNYEPKVDNGGVADDVCKWKQTSTARYKTECGYKLEEYFDTKACYCKQCGKKIKVVE